MFSLVFVCQYFKYLLLICLHVITRNCVCVYIILASVNVVFQWVLQCSLFILYFVSSAFIMKTVVEVVLLCVH